MTPLERAARALHKLYIEERVRNGVKSSDLSSWDDLGEDGRYYFTAPVRAVITAIREPTEGMVAAGEDVIVYSPDDIIRNQADPVWRVMIDALLEEGR